MLVPATGVKVMPYDQPNAAKAPPTKNASAKADQTALGHLKNLWNNPFEVTLSKFTKGIAARINRQIALKDLWVKEADLLNVLNRMCKQSAAVNKLMMSYFFEFSEAPSIEELIAPPGYFDHVIVRNNEVVGYVLPEGTAGCVVKLFNHKKTITGTQVYYTSALTRRVKEIEQVPSPSFPSLEAALQIQSQTRVFAFDVKGKVIVFGLPNLSFEKTYDFGTPIHEACANDKHLVTMTKEPLSRTIVFTSLENWLSIPFTFVFPPEEEGNTAYTTPAFVDERLVIIKEFYSEMSSRTIQKVYVVDHAYEKGSRAAWVK